MEIKRGKDRHRGRLVLVEVEIKRGKHRHNIGRPGEAEIKIGKDRYTWRGRYKQSQR